MTMNVPNRNIFPVRRLFGAGLFFLLICLPVFSQKHLTRSIVIHGNDTLLEVSIVVKKEIDIKLKADKNYHWFAFDKVRANRGSFSGNLLHGTHKKYVGDYRLVQAGIFNMGLKQGVWKTWDKEGNLDSELVLKDGEKHGPCSSYKNGKLIKTEEYQNGVLNGKTIVYKDSAQEVSKYKHGTLIVPKDKQSPKEKIGLFQKLKNVFTKKKEKKEPKEKKSEKKEPKRKGRNGHYNTKLSNVAIN